jgi:hypothetical protein
MCPFTYDDPDALHSSEASGVFNLPAPMLSQTVDLPDMFDPWTRVLSI